jgi:hypothetical protein
MTFIGQRISLDKGFLKAHPQARSNRSLLATLNQIRTEVSALGQGLAPRGAASYETEYLRAVSLVRQQVVRDGAFLNTHRLLRADASYTAALSQLRSEVVAMRTWLASRAPVNSISV